MKSNNTPNVSDLARWIDIQLSTVIEGVSAGYTLGNYNSVWIDKGATVFNVSLANGETVEIDSDNYNTAEEIANSIISTLNNNTPTTMNANETKAPEFSELSHTATNIVLTAENDGDIYRRHVAPLILSLTNKIKRGITPNRKRLAQSSAMRSIITASLAEMYCAGWMEDNTKVTAAERKEAANYLAWVYISDAEDDYNNQMAAYK